MRRWIAIAVAVSTTVGALAFAAPAGAQSSGNPDLAAARELVGSIPESQRDHCQMSDPATEGSVLAAEAASIRAMARCYTVGKLSTLWYILMDTPDSTNRLYRAYAGTFDPTAPYRDADAQCPGETTWGFGATKDDGMLACYYGTADLDGTPHAESALLVWSYPAGKIIGLAETAAGDADASALKKWWNDDAGPLAQPTGVKGLVDWRARNRGAEQTLLSHVPKATRGSCVVQGLNTGGSFFGARLWTTAVVNCTSDKVKVAYGSMNPAVVENFVDEFTPAQQTDPCPASGTWSEGKGKKRHTVGNYACFIQANTDGSQTAWMIWSQRKLGIAVTASLPTANNDGSKLYKWWEGDSGPV